jgi:glucose/arabinose dehydrogenase
VAPEVMIVTILRGIACVGAATVGKRGNPTYGLLAVLCSLLVVGCGDDDDDDDGDDGGTTTTAATTGPTTSGAGGSTTSTTTGGVGGSGGEGGAGGAGGEGGTGGEGGEGGAGGGPAAPDTVGLELVADGLVSPLVVRRFPDDTDRLLIADQTGEIWIGYDDGTFEPAAFLDLSLQITPLDPAYDERGVLGAAFHPDFATNGRIYVYYSVPLRLGAPAGYSHTNRISEFTVLDADPNLIDPLSERILLEIDQPQVNHNAGQIAFGPDGYLYIPIGDGGNADDVGLGHVDDWYDVNDGGNGQDLTQNLNGSILRIDVDDTSDGEYGIPASNPFADGEDGLPEVWAYGFRNPYRIAFDTGGDGQLFGSDAGQNRWEEFNIIEAGANHGWNVREGRHCFSTANPDVELDDCPMIDPLGNALVDPIIEYANANQAGGGVGFVSIGGEVYRGSAIGGLEGHYVYGDATRSLEELDGTLFAATPPLASGEEWTPRGLAVAGRPGGRLGEMIKSFGVDDDGEIFVLTSEMLGPSGTTGKVYRIVPAE